MALPPITQATRIERFVPAVTAMIGALALVEVGRVVSASLPVQIGEPQWRFQFFALMLAMGPQLTLLLAMIGAIAVLSGRRVTLKVVAITGIVLAVLLVAVIPFFALDFLTQRHLQPQTRLGAFDREAIRLAATAALLVPFLMWSGVRGIGAAVKDPTSEYDAERGLAVTQAGVPTA